MSSVSIIGAGTMARALGGGAIAGTTGSAPAGDIVILRRAVRQRRAGRRPVR